MIDLIIHSKDIDRTQLLINSINKNAPNIFYPIIIMDGYVLDDKFEYIDTIVDDGIFSNAVIDILSDSTYNNIGFSSDNMVIYKPLPRDIPDLYPGEVFSLKLGLNTTKQDEYNNIMQPELSNYLDINGVISWNAMQYRPCDYGYSTSLDMHMFNREQMLDLIKSWNFLSLVDLEQQLSGYGNHFLYMNSFKHSVAVKIKNTSNVNLETIEKKQYCSCYKEL